MARKPPERLQIPQTNCSAFELQRLKTSYDDTAPTPRPGLRRRPQPPHQRAQTLLCELRVLPAPRSGQNTRESGSIFSPCPSSLKSQGVTL